MEREQNILQEAELEKIILAIWREVLGVEEIGLEDNFLEIGGHSERMLEVQRLLKKHVDVTVGTVDMFRFPTVKSLAGYVVGLSERQQSAGRELMDEESGDPEENVRRDFLKRRTGSDF